MWSTTCPERVLICSDVFKGPIATRSNLLVTWKISLECILSLNAPWALLKFFHHGGLFSVTLAIKFVQFVPLNPPSPPQKMF